MDAIVRMRALLEIAGHYAEREGGTNERGAGTVCFRHIHNRAKITEEILTFYDRSWKNAGIDVNDEEINEELVERIITVTKNLFVDVVSTIEKTAKETVDACPGGTIKKKAMENRSYLYLRNILQASCAAGVISSEEFEEWDDILVMRNLVAHNNSVSDRSKKFIVSGVTVSMRPGRMMKGPLDTFIVLTERITELFSGWLASLKDTNHLSI